jgi:PD-(D/E)XK nuclease family transposase
MRPVFADPKTDFVFKRIFGSEVHKPLLIELLNDLLELSGDHRIVDLEYLSPAQRVPVVELKMSVVDVKCFDQSGRHYVVEMQVGLSASELDFYDRARLSEQDARGVLTLAKRQGREEELRASIHAFCQAFEIELGADREAVLAGMGTDELKALQARLFRERRWD